MSKVRNVPPQGFIATEADLATGVRALRRKCATMRLVHDVAGDPPLRRQTGGFEGLARIVVAQQLSVASAAAIWRRTREAATPFGAEGLLALDDAALRAAGLSAPKMRTLRALSRAVVEDGLDLDALALAPEEELRAALTRVTGIGPWTCDIYLMFCVGQQDAFAPGDLALQAAAGLALGQETRPTAKELAAMAERWRPWRGVAARLLWAYYKVVKERGETVPV